MFLVREVMHCKPGKVRDLLNKFKSVSDFISKKGMKPFRLYTDVSGQPFWTIIAEMEVESVDKFMGEMEKVMSDDEARKLMAGYHGLVQEGRREIYKIEG